MSRIHLLPPHLADQIAAGEVVERPAAALKELMENSLDAESTEIYCRWKQGGTALLEVSDNGRGIEPDDLSLALSRHATSKIRSVEDLFRIGTWGFRGEALASIAAVSNLTIQSRTADQSIAHQLACEGGRVAPPSTLARAVGTTVSVRDLFYNTPARKEFLKSQSAETSQCVQVFTRLALSAPQVHLSLEIDGEVRFEFSPKLTEQRILDVYRQAWRIDVNESELTSHVATSGPLRLQAHLLPANHHIPSSRGLFFFVNRRAVKDKLLLQSVMTASREVLFGSLYPQGALFLELPFDSVDVNVHPSKSEVRFKNPGHVFAFIRKHIEQALGAQRPKWTSVLEVPNSIGLSTTQSDFFLQQASPIPSPPQGEARDPSRNSIPFSGNQFEKSSLGISPDIISPETQRENPTFVQFLGTLKDTYLVCSNRDGLFLVDQHAAHERITYEKLKRKGWMQSGVTPLLVPIQLELQRELLDILEPQFSLFSEMGLGLERVGPTLLQIASLPSLLTDANGTCTLNLRKFFQNLKIASGDLPPEQWPHYLEKEMMETLATQSCHSSVRAGQRLNEAQARALLNQMSTTDFSGHCPHGRPTTINLNWAEIERLFKRKI